MAQVQLATKISIETHFKLEEYAKASGASKSSIVDAALIQFIDRNMQAANDLFGDQPVGNKTNSKSKPPVRGKDGKFHKAGSE